MGPGAALRLHPPLVGPVDSTITFKKCTKENTCGNIRKTYENLISIKLMLLTSEEDIFSLVMSSHLSYQCHFILAMSYHKILRYK